MLQSNCTYKSKLVNFDILFSPRDKYYYPQ